MDSIPRYVQLPLFVLEKRCIRCAVLKPLDGFHRNRNNKDGRSPLCKECACARSREWLRENKERATQRRRAYRVAHAGELIPKKRAYYRSHRTHHLAYCRARYLLQKEAHQARSRAYYLANREQICKRTRQWAQENPARVRAGHLRRRARTVALPGVAVASDIELIYECQRGRCAYCLAELGRSYHVDHMIPVVCAGSSHWPQNLALACPLCNLRKHARSSGQFFAWLIRHEPS